MGIDVGLVTLGEAMVIVNNEGEGQCQECGETNILDSTLNICFECWCILDLKEQENQQQRSVAKDQEE